jgi:hypothetical protein
MCFNYGFIASTFFIDISYFIYVIKLHALNTYIMQLTLKAKVNVNETHLVEKIYDGMKVI